MISDDIAAVLEELREWQISTFDKIYHIVYLGAIGAVILNTQVQLCIFFVIGNSLAFVSNKNLRVFVQDLKMIYLALWNIKKKWTMPI